MRNGLIKHNYRSGHYNRALEEAISTHKAQWAKDWESKNPLSGGATFGSMSPTERVGLALETFVIFFIKHQGRTLNRGYYVAHLCRVPFLGSEQLALIVPYCCSFPLFQSRYCL